MGAIAGSPGVRYIPSATKVPTGENYADLNDLSYLNHESPDLDRTINKRYGSQMIDGFFERTGRKIPYASKIITWTEEDRLTQLGEGIARTGDVFTLADHTFRKGEVITAFLPNGTVLRKGRIMSTTSTTFTASCGHASGWAALGTTGISVFADQSEFLERTAGMDQSLNTKYQQFETRGTITKEMVSESRTNMTQISWLKASDGSGYIWYDLNKDNTEKRFRNKVESAHFNSENWAGDLLAAGYKGRQGLLPAMAEGNIFAGNISDFASAESLIDRWEKQGATQNHVIYGTTAFCFAIDKFLASTNVTTGSAYGSFNNDKNMALDLSFKGYCLGGYDVSYSPLQYLKEPTAQGAITGVSKINGFSVPSGSQSVTDPMTGVTAVKPQIHVRHRAYGAMNRDYEIVTRDWAKGTNLVDEIVTEFQNESTTVLIGRNQTVLFRG
jgi:hypothetical protein